MSTQPSKTSPKNADTPNGLQRELEVWKTMYNDLSRQLLGIERERDGLKKTLMQKECELETANRKLAEAGRLAQDLRQRLEFLQGGPDAVRRQSDASE